MRTVIAECALGAHGPRNKDGTRGGILVRLPAGWKAKAGVGEGDIVEVLEDSKEPEILIIRKKK